MSGNPFGTSNASGGTDTILIHTQPASQTAPLGASAKFAVAATSRQKLTYQWVRNGVPIDGATEAAYTTPAIELGDNGAIYSVILSDKSGTLKSAAATLTAGPRSPEPGDLRLLLFQQAATPGFGASAQASDIATNVEQLFPGAIGSPLEIGGAGVCTPGVAYECGWNFFVDYLPESQDGFMMQYQGRPYEEFDNDLAAIDRPNTVVTSLDFEPANDSYAVAWVSTLGEGGFDLRREVAAPSEIADVVAADGAESRIVTAVSFDDAGQANLFSYGWTGDTATAYETRTLITCASSVAAKATELANQGYVVSAFGGNDRDGYVLVGTRVKGDVLPRPLTVSTLGAASASDAATPAATPGTPVANLNTAATGQVLISEY